MAMTSNYVWQEQTHRMPCNCGCPECTSASRFTGILTLLVGDTGKCFSSDSAENGETYVYLPNILSMTVDWCVSIWSTKYSVAVIMQALEWMPPNDSPFIDHVYINGIGFDGVTVTAGGTACFCWDGEKFVATGDVIGYNGLPT
jgi:hypothetical protein